MFGNQIGFCKSSSKHSKRSFQLFLANQKFTQALVTISKLSRDPAVMLLSNISYENCGLTQFFYDNNPKVLLYLDTRQLVAFECSIFPTAPFSNLYATWVFDRRTSYTVLQVYLPSYMIVILSFLALWIPQEAVPARVGLGITTVLTIVYFLGKKRNNQNTSFIDLSHCYHIRITD